MNIMETITSKLNDRLSGLSRARREGVKVIGYTPGGYLPEELVIAAGAIPLGLIRGGDHEPAEASGAYICRWIDPFCRSQIGYGTSAHDPYYSLVDLLVVPITDNHIRSISDILSYHTGIKVHPYGVPHKKDEPSLEYYQAKILGLKKALEDFTGTGITDQRLAEAIDLCNRERALFRKISLKRRGEKTGVSGDEFIALHHASHILDKGDMVQLLEEVSRGADRDSGDGLGPRIMLTGSTLALGDSKVPDLIAEAGGRTVFEEFAEGLRPYWQDVAVDGDFMHNLADAYYWRRVPPAWFRPGRERLEFLIQMAHEFKVDGVIWYQLMFRESYKIESYFFPDMLRKRTGLSMLTVESDYAGDETAALRTRIETYIHSIGG